MSIEFVIFGVIQLVRTPYAVEFSACSGVCGCGWSNLTTVVRIGTANFALMNNAPNSASATDGITDSIICKISRMALLFCGISLSLDPKKYPQLSCVLWLWRGRMTHCGFPESYRML